MVADLSPPPAGSQSERQTEVRRELSRDADDAHCVGPVRGDGHVEDRVVEAEHLADVASQLGAAVEREDAVVILAEAELACRAQHAFAHDAADLALGDLEVAGEHRAHFRERHDHSGLDVGGAAHDALLAVAVVDVGEADLVGVGVRQHVEDARRDHAVDLGARLFDRLDLDAELVQRVGDRGDVGDRVVERREVTDPGKGCAHGDSYGRAVLDWSVRTA